MANRSQRRAKKKIDKKTGKEILVITNNKYNYIKRGKI